MMNGGDDAAEAQNKSRTLRRLDSLDVEASCVPGWQDLNKGFSTTLTLKLAFESIGMIYGDMGTSPLYVFSSTFNSESSPHRDDVLGALCLIIYSLSLIPLIKYVVVVLSAHDNGNGGTFALYSLICRYAKVSLFQNEQVENQKLSGYRLPSPDRAVRRGAKIKEALECSAFAKGILLLLTLLGTCAVMGDGVLTPVISVLSAIDGIQTKKASLTNDHVVFISVAILVILFSVQRFGTEKVAFLFAPCIFVWFLFISGIGIFNIVKHDAGIFRAFNPYYIMDYFRRNGKQGWISLGGIVLALTGTEAMFADLGHFSVPSVRIAFSTVVYPSLLAAYIGQGAYLLKYPEDVSQTFYKSIPGPMFWPMFVVAVGAAIIASQAMISAVFSIVEQSLALGCFPTVKVVHTSSKFAGQVYIPEVNWILMILCVIVTGIFKTTSYIGNAYGMTVLAVMLVTTTLVTLIMIMIWQTKLHLALAFFIIFGTVEMVYFTANLYKFTEGGWLPVAFTSILIVTMAVWHYVTSRKYKFESDNKVSMMSLVSRLESDLRLSRVPGIGLMYTQLVQGVPPIFDLFVDNMKALHSVIVFVSVKHLPISSVPLEERFLVRRVGSKEYRMYRTMVWYGYMDSLIPHQEFEDLLLGSLEEFIKVEGFALKMPDKSTHHENFDESEDSSSNSLHPTREKKSGSDSNQEANATSTSLINQKIEELETEWEFVSNARNEGVTYLLGSSVVEASPTSSIGKRFVVNVLYDLLQRLSRKSRVALQIPHKYLVEVGITYIL
ncbi:hypothetical protein GOP47_0001656 [Adiantum capillus-veneris]|uniref:Potassium transporter n=1 Tax=Adiantum capillus-veneris TaxID=13818 RepID=A0A9D4V944_ADICA|nr:hypothetical protein GOP47_0001656 [Adiantum capillus-veneris]